MNKIALVRRNGLGDLLCAYPLILYLQKVQKASVTLFVDVRNKPLVSFLPPVEEVIIFPPGNKYWTLLSTAFRYRKQFDRAISAKTSPMKLMNLFLFTLGASERVAYVDSSWHSFLINKPIAYDSKCMQEHEVVKSLKLAGLSCSEIPEELLPQIKVPQQLRDQYRLKGVSQPILLISASTTLPHNRLDPARYAALVKQFHALYPCSVWIIGQKNDQKRAEEIAAALHLEHMLIFPRNFDEFMVLLEQADIFFVGDGGVAHIGANLGKKVVVLFGGTVNPIWRPLGKQVKVLCHPVHVNGISYEDVLGALKEVMQ